AGHSGFDPGATFIFCLVIVILLPLLEAAPVMLAAIYVHLIDEPLALAVEVSSIGSFLVLPLTVTGSPFLSLTAELYGRLSAFVGLTVAPMKLIVHVAMLSAVIDSVAVPGAVGFLTALAVKLDELHLMVRLRLPVSANTAFVPFTRLALSTAPGLTAVP